eukprot:PhF_6_TR19971/c0_g1_i4/m.29122
MGDNISKTHHRKSRPTPTTTTAPHPSPKPFLPLLDCRSFVTTSIPLFHYSDALFQCCEFLQYSTIRSVVMATCKSWRCALQSSNEQFMVPINGLTMWLDASDPSSMSVSGETNVDLWTSKLMHLTSLEANPQLGYSRSGSSILAPHEERKPQLKTKALGDCSGVHFDYCRNGIARDPLTKRQTTFTFQTIISVHSFEQKDQLDHQAVHGYPGELCNFYIFTDSSKIEMHGGAEADASNLCGGPASVHGKVKLNGGPVVAGSTLRRWTDQPPKLAVLSLPNVVQTNRIGADRECHQFCGTICELLTFDRHLSDEEIT